MTSSGDPRVDAYIAAAQPFARSILDHIRSMMRQAVPDVVETIKWNMPFFVAHGRNLAGMAAFKHHASLGLWRGAELGLGKPGDKGGMGSFGHLHMIADLPPAAELIDLITRAAALDAAGPRKATGAGPTPRPEAEVPDDLAAALAQVPAALAVWTSFAPSCRRDYVDWVIDAKRPETRERRIAQTVEQVAEGKDRNWKYRR